MKKVLLIAVIATVFLSAFHWQDASSSASPVMQWSKTYGGPNDDGAHSIVQTLDGGYAVVGTTQSFGAGGIDIWLVKTDPCGNMEWNKTYGDAMNDPVTGWSSVVQTSDEGYAIAGHTYSFGAGSADFWLIKTDEFGNMQWNKTYGGASFDNAWALMQTSDGGFILAGQTYSFGSGWCNAWLVKTDEFGNMEWNKTYDRKNYDYVLSFVQTSDGGYALAGRVASQQSFGDGDFWLVKTDSAGNMQWDKTYGGTGEETAHSVVQTTDGGYALTGLTNSFGAGSFDTWLVKTDSNGDMEWNQTYGGTSIDWAHSIVQTSDEGYALAGSVFIGTGAADFWLVKTDKLGNVEWNETYGGTNEDIAYSFVQPSDAGYALAGFTESFGVGNRDFWLVKTEGEEHMPPPPRELSIELSGEHDYLPWENVKVKVAALVSDVNTKEPFSDANVTITIYDPENNSWIYDTMTETPNTGIYLWESTETVKEIFRNHEKGVYVLHGEASFNDGPTASDILTFHIDPPPEDKDNRLAIIIGISLAAIAVIALAAVFIKKKRKP